MYILYVYTYIVIYIYMTLACNIYYIPICNRWSIMYDNIYIYYIIHLMSCRPGIPLLRNRGLSSVFCAECWGTQVIHTVFGFWTVIPLHSINTSHLKCSITLYNMHNYEITLGATPAWINTVYFSGVDTPGDVPYDCSISGIIDCDINGKPT